jgi:Rho GDP-dissociation inhibitor
MASESNEQDLLPEQTEGFKVGEKKTIDEYHKLGM